MANSTIRVVIDVVKDSASKSLATFKTDLANAEGGFNKLKTVGTGAMAAIGPAVAGAAATAGVALITFAAKSVAAFQDLALEAGKFSESTGFAVEDASKWLEVAGDVGVGASAIEGAVNKMNIAIGAGRMDDFAAEIVRTKDGVVDANATFTNLITKIGQIKDPTEKAEAAQRAFGKGWTQVSELMSMEAGELRESLDSVSDAKIIDEKELANARQLRDTMDDLADRVEDAALNLGGVLAPALASVAEKSADAAEKVGGAGIAAQAVESSFGMANKVLEVTNFALDKVTGSSEELVDWTGRLGASTAASAFEQRAAAGAMGEAEGAAADLGDEVEETKRSYERLKSAVDILKGALTNRDAEDEAIKAQNELRWAQAEAWKVAENAKATDEERVTSLAAVDDATRASIDALIAYIDTLGGIPEAKATEVAALIDNGSFDEAERMLAILTRNRQVDVQIVTRGGAGYGPAGSPRAAGGPVYPNTLHEVGEGGKPELLDAGGKTYLIPGNQGGMVRPSTSGGSMGGGGQTIIFAPNISAMDASSFSPAFMQRLMNEFERTMQRTGRVWSKQGG